MSARVALLAVLGLVAAVGVGLAANAISRDSIGLAPTPGGATLAPPAATTRSTATATTPKPKPKPRRPRTTATTTTPPPAPTATTDDHGGRRGRGGGHGSDD